jgi:hypothetical protein
MNVLVVNDTHFGSNYALVSEDKIQNAYQEWVYQQYLDVVKRCQLIGIDLLVPIGDLVDGYAAKDSTMQWTTDVHNQANCAVELLKKFMNSNTKVIGVGGSGYHWGKGTGFDGDRMVIEALGGKYNKNHYYLETPHGIIQFTHVGKNIKTEIETLQKNNGELDFKVKMLVNGHLHRYSAYYMGSVQVIHCPCWQYPTDFMQGHGVAPTVDIGCILIQIDEYGIIGHTPFKYPIPLNVTKEMSGWETINEDELKEKDKRDWEKLAQLSKVSSNSIQKIKRVERENLTILSLPEPPMINLREKKKRQNLILPTLPPSPEIRKYK